MRRFCSLLSSTCAVLACATVPASAEDFGAFYTRVQSGDASEAHSRVGDYADIIVRVPPGVQGAEYCFEQLDGMLSSGWQPTNEFTVSSLDPETSYRFHANARDRYFNETAWSTGQSVTTGKAPSPDAHWPLDDNAGTKVVDRAGSHDGTIVGPVDRVSGRVGQALRFEGTGYAVFNNVSDLRSDDQFTWAAWIKTSTDGPILGRTGPADKWQRGGKVLFVTQGRLVFDVGWVGSIRSNTAVSDGQWHHVAVTACDEHAVTLFIDGNRDITGLLELNRFRGDQLPVKIGFCNSDFPNDGKGFVGTIDDVRWYNCALNENVIRSLAVTRAPASNPGHARRSTDTRKQSRQAAALGGGRVLPTNSDGSIKLAGAIEHCHDPSRMVCAEGRYWVFSTANNVNLRSSTDMVHWEWAARKPFSYGDGVPQWMAAYLREGDEAGPWNLWAPDVIKVGDRYLLYYSRGCTDKRGKVTVCGLASSQSLVNPDWKDLGPVLEVRLQDEHYRVIDPAPIFDKQGHLWLAVGSFGSADKEGWENGGIRLFELNPSTGKLRRSGDKGVQLARSWMEAPFLWYHDGYYYLFFNMEKCCRGVDSTYFVQMGRAREIGGPYVDKNGRTLYDRGGSLFLGIDTRNDPEAYKKARVREIGPGHVGIFTDSEGRDWVTYHYYDSTGDGVPTLGMRMIEWTPDGWPVAQ